jgi:hypothetical protein
MIYQLRQKIMMSYEVISFLISLTQLIDLGL